MLSLKIGGKTRSEGLKVWGLIAFQYLRMMGGVDTVMPDKIVKRVINEILVKAGLEPVNDDNIEFIRKAEEIALAFFKQGYEIEAMLIFLKQYKTR
jgi:hypothetical protein